MNAVERVLHYAELPPEDSRTISNEKQPPPSWPDKGLIQFTNVKMCYREGLPLVLKGINISIQPGEKVLSSWDKCSACLNKILDRHRRPHRIWKEFANPGSSQVQTRIVRDFDFLIWSPFFRLIELGEGRIEVDNYDISHVNLNALRSRMAFVPQDTTLFLGTLRDNLYGLLSFPSCSKLIDLVVIRSAFAQMLSWYLSSNEPVSCRRILPLNPPMRQSSTSMQLLAMKVWFLLFEIPLWFTKHSK